MSDSIDAFEQPTQRKQRGMSQLNITLAAGVPQRFNIAGDYFHCITAPVNDLMVRFDDGSQAQIFKGVGKRVYYESFELSSATGQAVTVEYGFGSVFDGRASASVNVTTNIAPGASLNDGGDVVCAAGATTQLLAADATRLYATITNVSSNTVTVRIGTAGVGAANGDPVEPGTTFPKATTAAIYAYNPGPGAVTISAAAVRA